MNTTDKQKQEAQQQQSDAYPTDRIQHGWPIVGHSGPIGFSHTNSNDETPSREKHPIYDEEDGPLMTIAPTGAGKGTGSIVPALLNYPGPALVIDIKGELAAVTARRRREMGQDVFIVDPFGVVTDNPDTFNPIDSLDPTSETFTDDVISLTRAIVDPVRSTLDPFWDNSAASWISGMIAHVARHRPPVLRNLGEVHYLFSQSAEDFGFTIEEMRKSKSAWANRVGNMMQGTDSRVLANIRSTCQHQLWFLASEIIASGMSKTSIDVEGWSAEKPITIYLVLPPERLLSHSKFFRVILNQLLEIKIRARRRSTPATLFVVDEAAQLGALDTIRTATTLLRGYGIRVWTFWQDKSQLERTYPDDWRSMINNTSALQLFGFNNMAMAEDACTLTGYENPKALLGRNTNDMILATRGRPARMVRRLNYLADDRFSGMYDENPFYQGRRFQASTKDSSPVAEPSIIDSGQYHSDEWELSDLANPVAGG